MIMNLAKMGAETRERCDEKYDPEQERKMWRIENPEVGKANNMSQSASGDIFIFG